MPSAVVGASLANKAGNGGHAWTRASFVLGLRRLGFDVVFVEEIKRPSADACAFFSDWCRRFDVDGYLLADGAANADVLEHVGRSDLLLNVGGHLSAELRREARRRVFLDDDPGYTQFWHAAGLIGDRLAGHHAYFTYGANIGTGECSIPTGGVEWRAARPPVVLEEWPCVPTPDRERLTTIASWRGAYGRVDWDGELFGQKAHEFRRLAPLPRKAPQRFEIALQIDPADAADAEFLVANGWTLVDPAEVAGDADAFKAYVQRSGGEVSAAQGIYVETRSGWFSDRTAHYLASGRPALVQDTHALDLPRGTPGLIFFSNLDEAVAGAHAIAVAYDEHAAGARALAERHFDSDVVLGAIVEKAGL